MARPVTIGRRGGGLWSLVEPTETCWLWLGALDDDGYGKYQGTGAHLALFRQIVGLLPAGYELDHLCRNRVCVNPAHMDVVTRAVNVQRSFDARRAEGQDLSHGRRALRLLVTSCQEGHDFTPENTYTRPNGERECRECTRARDRRRYHEAKTRTA